MKVKVLLALFSLFLVGSSARTQEKASTLRAERGPSPALTLEDVLWWLPPDTETLMVARGPFQIVKATPLTSTERLLEKTLQLSALGNLAGPVEEEDEDARIPKALMGVRLQFALEGSRNFRAPNSLGSTPYDGCSIMVFVEDFGPRGDQLLRNLEETAHPTKKDVGGFPALVWQEKLEDDLWTFLLVRPRPNVFLVATQEAYLKETLERMENRGAARALPESLPEWKYVDRQARFWAVRHYDRQRAKTDPSSPFGGERAANEPDEQAIGVAFSYTASSRKNPTVYYFSDNPTAIGVARRMWNHPEEGIVPQARVAAPGVVEISVPVRDEDGISMFFLICTGVLGHGIYL